MLLTVCILATCALVPAAARAASFTTGLQDINAFDDGDAVNFAHAKAAGAKYLKLTVYWPNVAPDANSQTKPSGFTPTDPGDPAYSWGNYDKQVREAVSNGLTPIIDVTNSPKWARAAGCDVDASCTPVPAEYAAFATAIAKRYSGTFNPGEGTLPRVGYWQAWIEPNLDFFYKPIFKGGKKVSPENYRGILNAFYGAIHGVNNSNQVISAGLAPLQRPNHTLGPLDFMRRLLCMQGRSDPKPQKGCNQKAKLDIWATHPYTTGGPTHEAPGPDDVSLGDLPQMTEVLRAADKAGHIQNSSAKTPFWVTEFSWDSKPPDAGGLKLPLLARWADEAMYRMYKAGVSNMIWFGIRDEAKRPGATDADLYQSGLYLRGATPSKDKPKQPFFRAFQFPFVALKTSKGFTFWGRTPNSRSATVQILVKSGAGGYRKLKTAKASGNGIFQGSVVKSGLAKNAQVEAKIAGQGTSVPFSLKYVNDFYQPPFGGHPGASRTKAKVTPKVRH